MREANVITGTQLRMMFLAGSNWLQVHASQLNSLNVFPVADGDTGTNMALTMQAAVAHLQQLPLHAVDHAGQVAYAVSQGALLGSRGNSGTILSQIWCGFAEVMLDEPAITMAMFAQGLQQASIRAYEAVFEPVEGTILTIINQMSVTGERLIAHSTPQYLPFLVTIVNEAQDMLATTPNLLPQLHQAGVVDAGGLGLVYIIEGMVRHLQARPVDSLTHSNITPKYKADSYQLTISTQATAQPLYDVQFLIRGTDFNLADIRNHISQMGESPLVVGAKTLVKVHVHVTDPTVPLKYGLSQGDVADIVVENISEQIADFRQQKHQHPSQKFTIITIVDGVGFTHLFSQLGADIVLSRSADADISAAQLHDTIQTLAIGPIIILPNSQKAEAMATQVASTNIKEIIVLPAHTMPQGINALLALNQTLDLASNITRVTEALEQVNTLEIASNIRYSKEKVKAYFNGNLVQTGLDINQTAYQALLGLDMTQFEVVTLYCGYGIQMTLAQQLANKIHHAFPCLDLQVLDGGQANSIYIISLE